jgi:hypothetical protein
MKKALILTAVVVLSLVLGEMGIRAVESGGLPLWKLTTLFLSVCVFTGGGLFFLSYFFEKQWSGFAGLIWVCENILPAGGKKNALILGVAGLGSGLAAMIALLKT